MVAPMALCLRLACTLSATVIAAALSGCAIWAGPLLPTHPSTPTNNTVSAGSTLLDGWTLTTDPPTGVSVRLPTQPQVQNTTTTTEGGDTLPLRDYTLNLSDGRGTIEFTVADAPDRILDLDKGLQAVVAGAGSGGILTSSRHFDVDGHPAVDARYTTNVDGSPYVAFARLVADRGHIIIINTTGPFTQENSLNGTHQQILGTLHLI
jgi:hypothetical protein